MNTQALALVELFNHDLFLAQSKREREQANFSKFQANIAKSEATPKAKRRFLIPSLVVADWLQGLSPRKHKQSALPF